MTCCACPHGGHHVWCPHHATAVAHAARRLTLAAQPASGRFGTPTGPAKVTVDRGDLLAVLVELDALRVRVHTATGQAEAGRWRDAAGRLYRASTPGEREKARRHYRRLNNETEGP